ncbi:MAG: 4Fe-4S dicluster domain-containing protein [Cyanobacteria bacterium SIG31]|nr:4Fe-4S dicluster domain-containing protein [Cyanobacteria bacterium SIG31]
MPEIKIDKEKCIKCGACIKDCLTYSLEKDEEGFAKVSERDENLCISCQHCFAICPTGAITFDSKNPQDATVPNFGVPDDILNLIKSRRSIRQYKDEEISSEHFEKIKEMLPYIPTGCNFNGLHFSIIETKSAMDSIRNYTVEKLLKIISNKYTAKYAGKFVRFKSAFEQGEDVIFRGAPHMIVVSSNIKSPCANVDPIIALSYIELYAQSLGIGTCWCGFAQACFKLMPKLSEMINVPDGYKPVYAMLIGYPAVKYQRNIIAEKFPIADIKEVTEVKSNWISKAKRVFFNLIR